MLQRCKSKLLSNRKTFFLWKRTKQISSNKQRLQGSKIDTRPSFFTSLLGEKNRGKQGGYRPTVDHNCVLMLVSVCRGLIWLTTRWWLFIVNLFGVFFNVKQLDSMNGLLLIYRQKVRPKNATYRSVLHSFIPPFENWLHAALWITC